MEECCLLACSSLLAQTFFLENPMLPIQGCHYTLWVGTFSINPYFEKCLTSLLQTLFYKAFPYCGFLLSKDSGVCQVDIILCRTGWNVGIHVQMNSSNQIQWKQSINLYYSSLIMHQGTDIILSDAPSSNKEQIHWGLYI